MTIQTVLKCDPCGRVHRGFIAIMGGSLYAPRGWADRFNGSAHYCPKCIQSGRADRHYHRRLKKMGISPPEESIAEWMERWGLAS